jgi:hypothetical protein
MTFSINYAMVKNMGLYVLRYSNYYKKIINDEFMEEMCGDIMNLFFKKPGTIYTFNEGSMV